MNKEKLIKDLEYVEDKRSELVDNKELWSNRYLYKLIFGILEIQWDILQHIRRYDFNL